MRNYNDIAPKKEIIKKVTINKDVEPGNKIGIAVYKQIGQWCETCEDVVMHVYSNRTRKIRCLTCKQTKQL